MLARNADIFWLRCEKGIPEDTLDLESHVLGPFAGTFVREYYPDRFC
jgi:hypothetical protein